MRIAVDEGWRGLTWYYMDRDPNLESIRDDPVFQELRDLIASDLAMQAENPQGGWMFLNWGWQAGGEYEVLGDDGAWRAAFASEAVAEGFRFIQTMRWEDRVMPPSAMTRQNDVWQMFAAGQVAMTMEPAARHFFDEMRDVYDFDLSDIVCLASFLFIGGPAPMEHECEQPFAK